MKLNHKAVQNLKFLICLFYFSVPLWALALGWANWDWGVRALRSAPVLNCLVQGILLWVFVGFFLIQPLVKWVWIDVGKRYSRFQAISFSTVLLSLPLISMCYWLGDVRTFENAREVAVTIIPAVLLSTLIYDQTRSALQWSLSLFFMVFFYLFLINEILGPFQTYFYLLAHDHRFETLRALVPGFTLAAFYRLYYVPEGNSLSWINTVHHSWKRGSFAKVLKSADPGQSTLETEPES